MISFAISCNILANACDFSGYFRHWEAVSGVLALRLLERKYAPEFAFLVLVLVLVHEECFADSCSEETDSENEGRREEEKEQRGD